MMAISRQAYFQSLMMTVALIVGSAPAVYTQDSRIYEFCNPGDIIVSVRDGSTPFTIQSTNFGRGFYPNNVNCIMQIVSQQYPLVLEYDFGQFDVEYEPTCSYDSLTVNGVNYCGTWAAGRLFPNFLPQSHSTIVRFKTDSSVTKLGFKITVRPVVVRNNEGSEGQENKTTRNPSTPVVTPTYESPTEQEDDLTRGSRVYEFCQPDDIRVPVRVGSQFFIQSPNFGRDLYPNNVDCILTITSEDQPLVLKYYYGHFDVEYQQTCSFDSLTVKGVKYCGVVRDERMFDIFLPRWSSAVLRFKTNPIVRRRGFQIQVRSFPAFNNEGPTEDENNTTRILGIPDEA